MTYSELAPPPPLRELVECGWQRSGPATPARVLPDGCMDLIRLDGRIVVAGPDTTAYLAAASPDPVCGLRFRPGALPRLLGVPAAEVRDTRVEVHELRAVPDHGSLETLAIVLARVARRGPRPHRGRWPRCATSRAGSPTAPRSTTSQTTWAGRAGPCTATA
ncbi:DUF6597 domain-containing transcriptional factor [Mycolicibacterium goodii]|uniref:DUF6597 domain-containing transcriptional factor n=1 Tax=Mycolicibacterium goodii TaxID=134601 RepID=UPI00256ECE5F|nr:DUF6597 domain-containing transcriptional factor [Mycolicibacterium goodii]